jgi:uncharacterized protein (DUF4213/DUF364 family)
MKILDELIGALAEDAPAREVRIGRFWTAVWSRGCGLASTTGPGEHEHGSRFVRTRSLAMRTALELARLAHSESPSRRASAWMPSTLLEVDESR